MVKTAARFCIPVFVLLCISGWYSADDRKAVPVKGLDPPGNVPGEFLPEMIPGAEARLHGGIAISSRGDRILWSVIARVNGRPRGIIRQSTWAGGRWTGPEDLPLPRVLLPQAPAFDPAGELVFQARHPDGPGGVDICRFVPSSQGGDSRALPEPLNSSLFEGQPSFSEEGDLYLTVSMPGTGWNRGIARSRRDGDGWSRPALLPPPVNSPSIDAYPFISPGGDFLVFCSDRYGEGEKDLQLLVCFRNEDGSWSGPENLGAALGVDPPVRFPSLSPDGKVLFFQKGNRAYWVNAGLIVSLRKN